MCFIEILGDSLISNILVANDFSENANRALDFAADLAEKLNASITVVNVIQYVPGIVKAAGIDSSGCGSETGIPVPENYFIDMRKMSEEAMAKVVNKVKGLKPNLRVSSIVKAGSPVNEIISMSEDFDIIVIGHSGQDSLREAFMGVNSERIVNMVKCPVLVIP